MESESEHQATGDSSLMTDEVVYYLGYRLTVSLLLFIAWHKHMVPSKQDVPPAKEDTHETAGNNS